MRHTNLPAVQIFCQLCGINNMWNIRKKVELLPLTLLVLIQNSNYTICMIPIGMEFLFFFSLDGIVECVLGYVCTLTWIRRCVLKCASLKLLPFREKARERELTFGLSTSSNDCSFDYIDFFFANKEMYSSISRAVQNSQKYRYHYPKWRLRSKLHRLSI